MIRSLRGALMSRLSALVQERDPLPFLLVSYNRGGGSVQPGKKALPAMLHPDIRCQPPEL
jgi:hypothetical protein